MAWPCEAPVIDVEHRSKNASGHHNGCDAFVALDQPSIILMR